MPTSPTLPPSSPGELRLSDLMNRLKSLSENEQKYSLDRFRDQLSALPIPGLQTWREAIESALVKFSDFSNAPGVTPDREKTLYEHLLASVIYVQDQVSDQAGHLPPHPNDVFELESQISASTALPEVPEEDWNLS